MQTASSLGAVAGDGHGNLLPGTVNELLPENQANIMGWIVARPLQPLPLLSGTPSMGSKQRTKIIQNTISFLSSILFSDGGWAATTP